MTGHYATTQAQYTTTAIQPTGWDRSLQIINRISDNEVVDLAGRYAPRGAELPKSRPAARKRRKPQQKPDAE